MTPHRSGSDTAGRDRDTHNDEFATRKKFRGATDAEDEDTHSDGFAVRKKFRGATDAVCLAPGLREDW